MLAFLSLSTADQRIWLLPRLAPGQVNRTGDVLECVGGKAVNAASHFECDDVIDPAESRRWIARALCSVPSPDSRTGKKRPCVDTW